MEAFCFGASFELNSFEVVQLLFKYEKINKSQCTKVYLLPDFFFIMRVNTLGLLYTIPLKLTSASHYVLPVSLSPVDKL
jgi:hypothetical protein